MSNNSQARFAVVGHPNKGKSSIVSTLVKDTSIAVSSVSGTTDKADSYSLKTASGQIQLIDTPGFQRPTKVLKWLNARCENASERAATVLKLTQDPDAQRLFPDEVQLLTPVVNGAAILYVVDGSKPYGAEYEAEMEILRWTGQASMALINPIDNEEYVEEWRNALNQFFKSVHEFNPYTAHFDKQISLLETFAHMKTGWAMSLTSIVNDLNQLRARQVEQSIEILADMLQDMCSYVCSQKAISRKMAEQLKSPIELRYKQWLRERENAALNRLLTIFTHANTEYVIKPIELPDDLFDCEKWYVWGLDKKQLISAAAIGGAVSGAALDLAVAGSSFMLGTIGGGIVGAGAAFIGADKLLDINVVGLPMGGYQATVGPINNKNFPYVLIGRFMYAYQQISNRNHANREQFSLTQTHTSENALQMQLSELDKTQQKMIHVACDRLVKQKMNSELEETLKPLFK